MKRKKRIELILNKNFSNCSLEIKDVSILHKGHNNFDGTQESHFSIILNFQNQLKQNKLDVHRKINDLLKNEFEDGLHSLEIKIIN